MKKPGHLGQRYSLSEQEKNIAQRKMNWELPEKVPTTEDNFFPGITQSSEDKAPEELWAWKP